MNRWVVSGVALVIGLCGSFAAVSASQPTDGRTDGDLLGSIDFDRYCDTIYGPRSVPVPDSTQGATWGCAARNNGIFDTFDVDVDEACAQQFGEPSFARSWDMSIPDSWECFYGAAD